MVVMQMAEAFDEIAKDITLDNGHIQKAIKVMSNRKTISTSLIQRLLRVSYIDAMTVVDLLIVNGILGDYIFSMRGFEIKGGE